MAIQRLLILVSNRTGIAALAAAIPLLFVGSLASAAPRVLEASSSSPLRCRAPVRATRRLLAPGLRLIRVAYGLGKALSPPRTCPRGLRPTTRGPSGVLWATDTFTGLWKSTDDGANWRLAYDVRGYHTIERVLQLRSGRLLIVVDDSSGRRHILRSTDPSGTRFSAPVMDFPFVPGLDTPATAPRLLGSESWVQAPDSTIYVGEYVNDPHLIHLWRSTDDGKSFQVATTFADVRHIHSVFIDPYAPNRVWVAIGDTREQSRIMYSTDNGRTFTAISQGRYPESRAVGLMFTKQAVLWATDVPELRSSLYRWDRTSGRVTSVLEGLNGPFYYTAQFGSAYVQFSASFPKGQDGYLGDAYIHLISSNDGQTWSTTRTPWRIVENPPLKGLIYGITRPDNRGRFWVNFYALAGASSKSGRTASFELQLLPRT